ncbi:ABC transporter permease [Chitinophaga japonensis]|uniref:Putative permease n=1 Tax=Chitinophaga japonensis TaxID=104662 RepID=A0A562TBX1_CHIJA|nr:ABC transporter permease [Chitinophaga japonensis]TWI90788.1 putative permease [Chitinophaga japonensis]
MIGNYLKTAFRSLRRNKSYTFINIAGLTIGIAVCLVIFIVIRYESSFDNFHRHHDRIYRVMTKGEKGGVASCVPFPLPAAMKNDFPSWQSTGMAMLRNLQVAVMEKNAAPKLFKERTGAFLVEAAFFRIFNFPWLAGEPSTALQDPNSAVLTRSTAERYFGDWKNAMGKTIKVSNDDLLTITGILQDAPSNTDFQLSIVIPYHLAKYSQSKDWVSISSDHKCFVLLPPQVTAAAAERQLVAFSGKYRAADNKAIQVLQPLGQVHTDTSTDNYLGRTVGPERIRILWLIALFILCIACVNFINLSTAQAVNRAREIGVRKVLGSGRWQINLQFLLETCLQVLAGVMLALLIVALIIPPVNDILGITLSLHLLNNTGVFIFLLITTIVVTILAGFYPALVLSGFNPIAALKSRITAKSTRGLSLRRALVVFQFIIAQALIIGTLLLIRQINYFEQTPMGFKKDAIVDVPFPSDSASRSRLNYLRDKLMAIKEVQQVSFNSNTPADDDNWWTEFRFDHAAKETEFAMLSKFVDHQYVPTYQLPLAAGRNITATDSVNEFLVNEAVVKKLGFSDPNDVLNKEVDLWGGAAKGPIVGVLKNFHSNSLKEDIVPLFMVNMKRLYSTAGIQLSTTNIPAALRQIERIWKETYPNYVFEYEFLDERIGNFYREERQLSRLYKVFSAIAIFLSCLGLYGLASFMAVQRIKEVGIRKVLGATTAHVVYLFSKDFMLLIAIAFVIACPLTWYFMHQWLQHFVYHINIGWWTFVAGGLGAVVIALVTISFQAIKAGMANPAESLKVE